jgi:hypothetical protein
MMIFSDFAGLGGDPSTEDHRFSVVIGFNWRDIKTDSKNPFGIRCNHLKKVFDCTGL